jgi:cytochrome c oxidase assembly factor CtaG
MSFVLAHWSPVWPVLAIWVVLAAGRMAFGARGSRVLAFQGGLLVALFALVSPLAYWSLIFIWVRSIQDLLLGVVAPALIVLGRPDRAPAAAKRTPWWLRAPVAVAVVFNLIWLGWHLPALYDLAATSTAARYLEFATYLAAGTLFWLQLFGSGRSAPAAPPMRRLQLLVGTVVADTILGMVLVFGSGVIYPVYRGAEHRVLTVVADQQVGGAVLWMGMLPPLIIASVALLLRWLDQDESDELSRDLDRLTAQAAPAAGRMAWASSGRGAWLTRSGDRRPTT